MLAWSARFRARQVAGMNTPQEFAELLRGLREGGAGGALATIVRTRGSTFRRAGARMLIRADGSRVRGLSGGCPENDIALRAQAVIASGQAQIARYDRESSLDVLIEMGCGGELEVLIEPLDGSGIPDFVQAIEALHACRDSGWLATAFACDGACIAPVPWHRVWRGEGMDVRQALPSGENEDGNPLDEPAVLKALANSLQVHHGRADGARVVRVAGAAGMLDVLMERLRPPHAIVLIGINATSLALARLARPLGWRTTLVNSAGGQTEMPDLPAAALHVIAEPSELAVHVTLDADTSVVVMTHQLNRDLDFLTALVAAPVGYLGVIGSRERAARLQAATGLAPPRLRAPAGLDVGSETPEEIALAIAAEILAVRNGHRGSPLSLIEQPIH